jgi:hypothetical protein
MGKQQSNLKFRAASFQKSVCCIRHFKQPESCPCYPLQIRRLLMAITDTQQAAQSAASAAVSAAEAKQYLLEAQQGYEDTSTASQDAKDAADSALLSKQSAETSEVNAQQAATEAKSARDEAVEAASAASDYARNKFTFFKTPGDPDGTIAGLAATTNDQSFWVAQGRMLYQRHGSTKTKQAWPYCRRSSQAQRL